MNAAPKAAPQDDLLRQLYDKLVEAYTDRLDHGEDAVLKDGSILKTTCTAATLKEIREFLKSQGIDADGTKHKGVQSLASKLPFQPE
jgi:hypothetical protein